MQRRRLQSLDAKLYPDDYRLLALHPMLTNLGPQELHEDVHYKEALYWLRQAFAHSTCPQSHMSPIGAVLYWAERIPQEFLDLLTQKKPRAVILLAHFCVLVKRASHYWFCTGAAEEIMMEIQRNLDTKYLPWIEWPLQNFRSI